MFSPFFAADRRQGQTDHKRGSLTFTRAQRAYGSTVKLDKILDDRKPQPQSPVGASGRGIGLTKSFKDVGQDFGLNSDTRIVDSNFNMRIDAL
jgi:hypothetical protein